MTTPIEYAQSILADPSVDRMLDVFKEFANEGRRHGETWAEIAIAKWLREQAMDQTNESAALALRTKAEEIETKAWRRPEFFSSHDLEAEAAKVPSSRRT